ncbi:Nrap protein [Crassisporium funariophilum]|nr:Nrap protein [Crassisporium funariophilum]
MVQDLKRKRAENAGPSKIRRTEEDDLPAVNSDIKNDNQSIEEGGQSGPEDDERMDEDDKSEEWGGIGGEQAAAPSKEGNRTGTKPKKPPTGEELRDIKDATDLFKSSSFKLQIDALLPNVRPKTSRIPPLDRCLFALHSFLMGIPSIAPQHPLEAARKLLKKGVAVPYSLPLPTEETNWKVGFEPPSDITLVGSWANKVSVKPKDAQKFGVDLAVEMPDALFQEKDYLNGRFFHKRSFYLATIVAALQNPKSGLDMDVAYESLQGDPRLTKIVLTPKNNDSLTDFTKLNAEICILPVLSGTSPISLHRLSPTHSNIRVNTTSDVSNDDIKSPNRPTPLYNNALLRTLAPKYHLLAIHGLQNTCVAFSDALTLLRIWANQRGYSEGTRMCVRGFEGTGPWWWSLLALLLTGEEVQPGAGKAKRKSVGKGISSYQLFKASLEFLAKHDFEKGRVFVKSTDGHRFPPEEYLEQAGAVFVDSASLINLLANVPLGSLDLLKYDAAKTLETLNQSAFSGDPFTGAFLKDSRDLSTRFDVVFRINLSSAKPRTSSIHSTLDSGSPVNALLTSLSSLIRRGLGDRSRAVAILHPSSTSRPISQAHPSSPETICIGVVHNPQHAFRLVDHGPAADDQDQAVLEQFREFWGDKSELRRFKDGRIVESVVWEVTTADERAHVPAMIVRHLLKRHFNIGEDDVETWQTPFDSVLRLPQSISQEYLSSKISTGFKGALTAFDNLVKAIKKLDDDLPLTLLNISPTSEFLRYTSVFSPVPLPAKLASLLPANARYLAPIDIVIEFEKSSKWPDDLKAVQTIKLAFFERVASALMESVTGLIANVVVGDGIHDSEILDKAHLSIVTPEGWAFSARIWHDREVNLLDRIIQGTAGILPHVALKKKDNKKSAEHYEALEAKEIYLRRFVHAPGHHRAIAALCHHYSAFSGTVRLVKRWLASHWLLQGHISEEVVEIICANFFVGSGRNIGNDADTEQTAQHLVPGSKEHGFAAVVQFLKEWKWEDGIFVPLYGSGSASSSDSPSNLSKAGARTGAWKVATEHDRDGHVWTGSGPDLVVAHRVRALAAATWNCLQGLEQTKLDVQVMFVHPTDDYDFIIHLDPSVLPRYLHNINADPNMLTKRGRYANKPQDEQSTMVLPGFDPARMFFNDLQRMYADTLKVFYDPFGGDRLGVVWDPTLREPRPFRVLGGFSSLPVKKENEKAKDKGLVVLNQDGITKEIERLGTGLIKKITIHAR